MTTRQRPWQYWLNGERHTIPKSEFATCKRDNAIRQIFYANAEIRGLRCTVNVYKDRVTVQAHGDGWKILSDSP